GWASPGYSSSAASAGGCTAASTGCAWSTGRRWPSTPSCTPGPRAACASASASAPSRTSPAWATPRSRPACRAGCWRCSTTSATAGSASPAAWPTACAPCPDCSRAAAGLLSSKAPAGRAWTSSATTGGSTGTPWSNAWPRQDPATSRRCSTETVPGGPHALDRTALRRRAGAHRLRHHQRVLPGRGGARGRARVRGAGDRRGGRGRGARAGACGRRPRRSGARGRGGHAPGGMALEAAPATHRVGFDPWILLGIAPAHAQTPDITIRTPAIQAIQQRMESRFASTLRPHFDSGALGFSGDGLVVVRDASLLPLRDRVAVNAAVADDNRDRNAVYREIAVANGHPEWERQIREVFSRQWVASARPGWWYQSGGAWKQK